MKQQRGWFTLFTWIVCFWATTLYAQLGTSSLEGQIVDKSGSAVPGSKVTIKQIATGGTRVVETSTEGYFSATNLSPGVYEVAAEKQGFAVATAQNVELLVGRTTTLNLTLEVAATATRLEVEEAVAAVETSQSQVQSLVTAETVAHLPLNGRNFLDLAFLTPGNRPAPNYDPTKTNTIEVSSAGQLGRGGNISVDGGDNNDDVVGGTLQNFSQEAIQEFQVITNRFSAEIGRSASSAVNIITKSGTNEIHGNYFFFFRHRELTARTATEDRTRPRPPFDREQQGGTIGGPFKKDRAFWFFSFEHNNQDGAVQVGERDLARQRVVTTFGPAPLNDKLLTSKVDWQATTNHKFLFRYSLQRENDVDNGSLRTPNGSLSNRQFSKNNYQSFIGGWTYTISSRALNDFRFHENNFINKIDPLGTGNELRFPDLQTGQNFRVPQRTRQNRIQVKDTVAYTFAGHTLKFGGEYQRLDTDALFDLFGSGTVILTENFASRDRNGDGRIDDNDIPIAVTIRSLAPNRPPVVPDVDNNFFAWFIQDDWRARKNLTLNVGLRYELDTNTKNLSNFDEINPLVRPFLAGSRHRDKNNFGPRFGFAWDPRGNAKTVVRGGYGIYYDRIVLEVPLLERLLDGRALPLDVRAGSELNASGNFVPGTPTLAGNRFGGAAIAGAGAIGINIIDNGMDTPYVQQFNFGLQHQLISDFVVSADYVHALGQKFIIGRQIGTTAVNPVSGAAEQVVNLESSVSNKYDGLLLNFKKRMRKHWSLNASYTLSKAFNFSNDDQIPFQVGPLDNNNLRREYGPPPNDQRHRFVLSGVFELPYQFLVSPILTLASNVPMDIQTPITGTRIPQIQRNAGGRQFNTGAELNAFIDQLNARGGVNGQRLPRVRDNLRLGDGFSSLDLRVTKTFKFSERLNLQLIAEMFNLFNVTNVLGFNNVNYSGFANTLVPDQNNPNFSSTFGSAARTAGGVFGQGGPRAAQFAAKFNF